MKTYLDEKITPAKLTPMKNIFIIAGECSADLHASEFIKQMQKLEPDIAFWGIGGQEMQKLGFDSILPFEKFSIIGFAEVIKHLKFFFHARNKIKLELERRKPNLAILVDYPGLNIRIAKIAKMMKIPVLYYISPQIWAWKNKRIYKIKQYTDKVAVIFPFEKELYEKVGADVEFTGHPVSEEIEFQLSRKEFARKYNLDENKNWLAFMPGSRDVEIRRILPEMVKTIKELKRQNENRFEFLISISNTVSEKQFYKIVEPIKSDIHLVKEIYELMKYSHLVVCKSGTSTLQTGYIGTPMIVVYKTSLLSYFIAKNLIKIKMIAMPNIISEKKIVPELIQRDVKPSKIIQSINIILDNDEIYQKIKKELAIFRKKLGGKKTSENLANIVLSMCYETKNEK